MYWFTSDEHYGHQNILKYSERPFETIEEMDNTLIENHNSIVKKDDITIHAGDFTLWKNIKGIYEKYINNLNGNHIFLKGSHDYWLQWGKSQQIWEKHINKHYFVVCHYNMRTWARSHYNSIQLFGHCLDLNTEILTNNGWKYRNELNIDDKVITLNIDNKKIEYNNINEIINYENYTGNVYSYISKGINLRVTENHVLLDISSNGKGIIRKFYAKNISDIDSRSFIKSGEINQNRFDISDDQIKLLVWIAADGNICNSNLCRIGLSKERKIIRIRELLNKLSLNYNELPQKNGRIMFNFSIPSYFQTWSLKPISKNIIKFNREQIKVLLEEYSHTDGYKNGKSILIYTSKKEEADLIQYACIINGFICNISERNDHGFSKKTNYELVITNKKLRRHGELKNKVQIENVINEHFWCVKTDNQTIMIRRNGKPLIVGNSHGRLQPTGQQHDIGVDNNNFYPLSSTQIISIMRNRDDNSNLIRKNYGK